MANAFHPLLVRLRMTLRSCGKPDILHEIRDFGPPSRGGQKLENFDEILRPLTKRYLIVLFGRVLRMTCLAWGILRSFHSLRMTCRVLENFSAATLRSEWRGKRRHPEAPAEGSPENPMRFFGLCPQNDIKKQRGWDSNPRWNIIPHNLSKIAP